MNHSHLHLDEISARRRTPTATYRLQFNRDFTFDQAAAVADYARDLGVTEIYASPLFQAGPESTHGYDICSFEQFNPALGGRQGFEAFSARLRELGLGLILDMVPNHMGNDLSNRWWADVLEHGRNSPFSPYFDIDWGPVQSDLRGKVLLPALGDHYATVLEAGKLRLIFDDGAFAIACYDRKFPIAASCYEAILDDVADEIQERVEDRILVEAVRELSERLRQRQAASEILPADSAALQAQLRHWNQDSTLFHDAVASVLGAFNGEPGKPRSFDKLHALLDAQHYRLAYWRAGPEEINYRRFFDVTELVSVRMELPMVFQACHQLVFELLQKGHVTGLRIDHPDGLWDPQDYFRRLQAGYLLTQVGEPFAFPKHGAEAAVSAWLTERLVPLEQAELHRSLPPNAPHTLEAPRNDPLAGKTRHPRWPLYVIAEKILTGDEPLRQDWPIDGTTGYDFLNVVNGLFVDSANEKVFSQLYEDFTGDHSSFKDTVYRCKKNILENSLVSEWNALAQRLKQLARKTRYGQDFTLRQLRIGVGAIIAAFPVYRGYVTERSKQVASLERFHVEQSVADTKSRHPNLEVAMLDFIQDLLLLRPPADFDDEARQYQREFIGRFQQLTGPVTAKGLEDTSFYNYGRLISLNDVGGDPDRFGVSPSSFHKHNLLKAEQWPDALLATATHDTKRGEDVRARINVLSELPSDWQSASQRWARFNADKKTNLNGQSAPTANDEWFLYQTLLGAWPHFPPLSSNPGDLRTGRADLPELAAFRERVAAYMQKVLKEAKAQTSWTDPNAAYEKATRDFVTQILDPNRSERFLNDFLLFQSKIAFFGHFNSLSQLLLKITSPGVPDFYQGAELWDLSLVDPDNRGAVDYPARRRLLSELRHFQKGGVQLEDQTRELLATSHTGAVKLYVMTRALAFRQRYPALFREGEYVPLSGAGPKREHACAFARRLGDRIALTVVPRLVSGLVEGSQQPVFGHATWRDTCLDLAAPGLPGRYRDMFTGREIVTVQASGSPTLPLSDALGFFPVALLERLGP